MKGINEHIIRCRLLTRFIHDNKISIKGICNYLRISHGSINLRSGIISRKHVCDVEEYLVQFRNLEI